MSTIGRVFIVLNLVLAGVFVGFAATYLQGAADWKKKHADEVSARKLKETELTTSLDSTKSELDEHKRRLLASETQRKRFETENKELRDQNETLGKQLDSLDAAAQKLKSDYGQIASNIERSTTESGNAFKLAQEASTSKDEAVRARLAAEADLKEAQNKITELTENLGANEVRFKELDSKLREQDMLLAIVKQKAPGLLGMAQPDLSGTVQHVGPDGKLVTISVPDSAADM
jgi:chromosome segregation ATPase